jgi:PAS domain S-box-containing protein
MASRIPPDSERNRSGLPFDLPVVLDTLREGCQLIGFDFTYLYINAAAAAQGRRPQSDFLGRSMQEIYPGLQYTPMFEALSRCMVERTHHVMENRFTYPDGTSAWFELRFDPVEQGLFILSLDITERKEAVEDRQRLATAIDQAAEAVVITNLRGDIQYVNPAFEKLSGYSRAEVLGRNPRILKSGRQDAVFYREMWQVLQSGRAWHGRFINRRKDGKEFTQDSTVSPVLDTNGETVSFVGVSRDVSIELRLESDLRQAQKMETIGRLAGGIAHDFNNILSVIIAYADVVMSSLKPDDPVRTDIGHIRQAGDRAAGLTKQLLAFSRQQMLEPEVLDLGRLVHHMGTMLGRLIGEDVELTLALAPGLGLIKADPRQLEQVLLNLVVNARDAMPRGGQLTISTADTFLDEAYTSQHPDVSPGRFILLAVTDSGTGMSEATRQRIFDPFFTTKEAGKGTGLGLATVYGIVKQSGGHIWVYSEEGRGTTFKIYLPRYEGSTPARVAPARRAPGKSSGETILVVEDEDAVRRIAERILTAAGYIVLTAANGVEAITVLERHGRVVDLLLTDVVMPIMNGRDLAHKVAELCPDARILFMSGYTDDAIVDHGVLEPGVQFIEKPFNVLGLQLKVREVLDA